MNTKLLLLGLAAIVLQASAEPPRANAKAPLTDYETLRTAAGFCIGPVGIAAATPPEEEAYRRLLQTPTAADDCRKLIAAGTPAGQTYGLLGLKLLKDKTYAAAAARYRNSRVVVEFQEACDIHKWQMFFVVQLIDEGKIIKNYAKWLKQ